MKRFAAVIAAIVMIGAAVVVRNQLDDDGGGGGGDGSPARLLCAEELEDACLEIDRERGDVEVTVEPAGVTLDFLSSAPDAQLEDLGFDGWLAPAPLSVMVNRARDFASLRPAFEDAGEPRARSPLVMALRNDRRAVLEDTAECGGSVGWACVGRLAGRTWSSIGGPAEWGTVTAGHPNPELSATGLLVMGQAASEFLGTTDFSTTELESDPAFGSWFSRLEGSGSSPPFASVLAQNFINFNVVGTTEAEAGPALAAASGDRRDATALIYVDPVATADVVLALTTTTERGGTLEDAIDSDDADRALAESGWRVDGEDLAPGVHDEPGLPDGANLPGPIGLEALEEQWRLL